MTSVSVVSSPVSAPSRHRSRSIDNLKVLLVTGVIVGHTTMAWTGVGDWVFDEPHVREPLLSVLVLASVMGALFSIPLFFLVAGVFTPASLERKGPGRFLTDRVFRLGIPLVFFIVFLSPVVEYVDPENAGWDRGFVAFLPEIWWPPAPGPTWFLGVLLLFSAGYALLRTVRPRGPAEPEPLRARYLVIAAAAIVVASYVVRLAVPLGDEVWRLALGQAPAWVVGFSLGVVGGERDWFRRQDDATAGRIRVAAQAALGVTALVLGAAAATGADMDLFAGGGTWQSLVTTVLEGALIVTVAPWLIDLFRRRFDRQGPVLRDMSRSAYAAFVLHQVVLVYLVLATRRVELAPEVEYLAVGVLGVAVSFGVASLVMRLPGVSRVV